MSTNTSVPIRLPQMGESLVEGTVVRWLCAAGDHVERDQDLLEIETEKTSVGVPSPVAGTVREIRVAEGITVPVGTVLALVQPDGSEAAAVAAAEDSAGSNVVPEAAGSMPRQRPAGVFRAPEARTHPGYLSPAVTRIAREHGLSPEELRFIQGTGGRGRIRRSDLELYLRTRTTVSQQAARGEWIAMSRTRQTLAEHMLRSVRLAPHAGLLSAANMQRIVEWRESVRDRFEELHGFRITYTPIIVQAVARVLEKFPMVNVEVDGDHILLKKRINVGVAVAAESYGLIVPVIRDANRRSLLEIARSVNDLATRARRRELTPEDVAGGSFTITNVGTFGCLTGLPIINHPEVAILCAGVIHPEVVPVEGRPAVRSMLHLSLVFDHRVIDGELGGRFLQSIVHELEGFRPPQAILDATRPAP